MHDIWYSTRQIICKIHYIQYYSLQNNSVIMHDNNNFKNSFFSQNTCYNILIELIKVLLDNESKFQFTKKFDRRS